MTSASPSASDEATTPVSTPDADLGPEGNNGSTDSGTPAAPSASNKVTSASPSASDEATTPVSTPDADLGPEGNNGSTDSGPDENTVTTPNPVAPSPPTPAPYNADNACREATSCSECFNRAVGVYSKSLNRFSCKWDKTTDLCTKGGADESINCETSTSGGSNKVMFFFIICAGGVAFYYNNRRRPIPPRGKDKGGTYQR